MRGFRYARRGPDIGRGERFGPAGLAFVVAIAAGCDDAMVDPLSNVSGTRIPPAHGCTNPNHSGSTVWTSGLHPRQIAAAYGIDKLWDAGFRGQGRRVALIEPGQRLDSAEFRSFSECFGPFNFEFPVEIVVRGGRPSFVGDEPNFDSQTLLTVAPELEKIYLFESGNNDMENLPHLLAAALDPARTDGELVHAISISYGVCEAAVLRSQIERSSVHFKRAAELGVKVFIAMGDQGSPGWFPGPVGVNCVDWPAELPPPPGVELGVIFPPSTPWAIAVGGTELAIDGRIPFLGSREGGILTSEVVWNQHIPDEGEGRWVGAGGRSSIFSISEAIWQNDLAGLTGMRQTPDVAAMAGSPFYPGESFGTSGAAPMVAGAMMVVDSYLLGHGIEPPGFLSPVLYRLALTDYERVFRDVVEGDNDVYNLGCCYAKPGYDMASGLGAIRFDQLAEVLRERPAGPDASIP